MKIGRFSHIPKSSRSVILNWMWTALLFIACSLVVTAHAQAEESSGTEPENMKDTTFESNFEELLTTVYCYCGCTRETIEMCRCGTAGRIENDFRDRLLAGETVEQIRTDYLDTYGPQYYAVMPVEGINILAYAMPIIILILIGGVVFVVLQRSTRSMQKTAAAGAQEVSESQVSDETVKQVEAELERFKQES